MSTDALGGDSPVGGGGGGGAVDPHDLTTLSSASTSADAGRDMDTTFGPTNPSPGVAGSGASSTSWPPPHPHIPTAVVASTADEAGDVPPQSRGPPRQKGGFTASLSLQRIPETHWEDLSGLELLGQGSGTSLFIATLAGEKVVVKTPKDGLSPKQIEAVTLELQHEARMLFSLSHPNIAQLKGHGNVYLPHNVFVYFIVVEHLAGGTLASATPGLSRRRGRRVHPDSLEAMHSLCSALAYLQHEASMDYVIIHRDLKPDNIGFTADGTLKLFDFGLSTSMPRPTEDQVRFGLTGVTGSIRYMAPEVALGQFYTHTADVYSFALVCWEIVHGKKPFAGMDSRVHRDVVCRQQSRPDYERHCPKPMQELIAQCWAPDPDARPPFIDILARLTAIMETSDQRKDASSSTIVRRLTGLLSRG